MKTRSWLWPAVPCAAVTALLFASGAAAQETAWQVSKASGDVWVTGGGATPVSLGSPTTLKSGDEIRTGRNGRVLLMRGEETILISPNSVLGLPESRSDGPETTIVQKAGELVLTVEKKTAPHFEVETPYLAALVKGTRFRVTVDRSGSEVHVLEGKVQVSDFKSGQFALVLPGQAAEVSSTGRGGLSLAGPGTLGPIEQGTPVTPKVTRVPVPRHGLTAPRAQSGGQEARAIGDSTRDASDEDGNAEKSARADTNVERGPGNNAIRVSAPLGEVSLDVSKATKGFARSTHSPAAAVGKSKDAAATVWNSDGLSDGNGASKSYGKGNNGSGNGSAGSSAGGGNSKSQGKGSGNGSGNGASAQVVNAATSGNGNGNGKGKGKGLNR